MHFNDPKTNKLQPQKQTDKRTKTKKMFIN